MLLLQGRYFARVDRVVKTRSKGACTHAHGWTAARGGVSRRRALVRVRVARSLLVLPCALATQAASTSSSRAASSRTRSRRSSTTVRAHIHIHSALALSAAFFAHTPCAAPLRLPPRAGFYIWHHEAQRTMWNTVASGAIVLAVFACTLFPVARAPSLSHTQHNRSISFARSTAADVSRPPHFAPALNPLSIRRLIR
jgi:hypothetical protein